MLQLASWPNMTSSILLAVLLNYNSAALAWHVHKHKDRVSHQGPQQPSNKGTCPESWVWGLISKAGGGGWQLRACWALLPRGKDPKLGWRIHSDCPPQGWKTVTPLMLFCDRPCGAGQGRVRCGAVTAGYGGGVDGWRSCGRDRCVTTHTHVYT